MTEIVAKKYRTNRWRFQATADDQPLDLTGQTLYFTVKKNFEDPDIEAVVQLTNGNGITVDVGTQGFGEVTIGPDDLDEFPDYPSSGLWSLVVVDAQERQYEIDGGEISVEPSVLRSTGV